MSSIDDTRTPDLEWLSDKILSVTHSQQNTLHVTVGSAVEAFDTKIGEFFLQPTVLAEELKLLIEEYGNPRVECGSDIHGSLHIIATMPWCADYQVWVPIVEKEIMHLVVCARTDMLQQQRISTPAPTLCSLILPIARAA